VLATLAKSARMIEFELYIDGPVCLQPRSLMAESFYPPTGSTAYSLSAAAESFASEARAMYWCPMFPHYRCQAGPSCVDANS